MINENNINHLEEEKQRCQGIESEIRRSLILDDLDDPDLLEIPHDESPNTTENHSLLVSDASIRMSAGKTANKKAIYIFPDKLA